MSADVHVRREGREDVAAIRDVNLAAFDTTAEADLVDALREQARPVVSLVAVVGGAIVGHVMFSPVTLPGDGLMLMGLAPMAVRPSHQRQRIGSALVRAGLDACRDVGAHAVVVLGHPAYYPRFGFSPASRAGLRTEYDVPNEAFMVMELVSGALGGKTGTVRYHAAFTGV